jgi:hypothetical protein
LHLGFLLGHPFLAQGFTLTWFGFCFHSRWQ